VWIFSFFRQEGQRKNYLVPIRMAGPRKPTLLSSPRRRGSSKPLIWLDSDTSDRRLRGNDDYVGSTAFRDAH
jgi:hypothetical protein